MTQTYHIGSRITSLLLVFALIFSMLPALAVPAGAADLTAHRVSDPSGMDGWKNLFPISGNLSTENAGRVWMDKSVFTDASAFAGLGITQNDPNGFLVALSAIAANMTVTGMSHVPTDSVLILDVSGSMNDDNGNNDMAEELVEAANESIDALLSANAYNRVSVILYSGMTDDDAVQLLPLGRYTTGNDKQYLKYEVESGRSGTTETISIHGNVRIEGTNRAPASVSKTVYGATYIQKGVMAAVNQFLAESNSTVVEDPSVGTINRKPVVILMSDGAPTLGSTNFTNPGSYNLGTGYETSAALGFVTQLSLAYAKAKIEEKYATDALFYTLGLGVDNDSVAVGVLDPSNSKASTAMNDFWASYNRAAVGGTVTVQSGGRGQSTRTVTKIGMELEKNYVDQYFSANTGNMLDVFDTIVSTIQLQSGYFPTLISENEDLSGYLSFVDKIGSYMEVTDVKGILIGDHLFSGANLASNFVPGGGELGSFDNPTALGAEMVAAVRARLGLANDDTARTLIGLAYEYGQLSYTDANNYSNYIGWYANAKGEFLGFYNEGTTVLPAATGNAETDPAFVIRSYGYLGEVDISHGVTQSDMMYATVQVRKNIATGEELVTFAVPAALIPLVSYNVSLDESGRLTGLTASGATAPIRLVYEVALDDAINSFNVKELVSTEYLSDPHNVNADGSVNFYTNQWDHQNTTGYGTVNTYSYFNPSRQNDRYYYLEDTPVYADTNGTLYTGQNQPSADGTFYRMYTVYKNNGSLRTETVYREISDAAKATALRREDGAWYIPKGNVHVNLDGYTVDKTNNATGTLDQVLLPFVDTQNHSVNDAGYQFYVGATLGNNGKMTVIPETGLKLTKAMAADATTPTAPFVFELTNVSDPADNNTYPAWLVQADGTTRNIDVVFTNSKAAVELNSGDALYIGGMTGGTIFRVEERQTAQYLATVTGLTDAGLVSISAGEIKTVAFVNEDRGIGNLTIAKEISHSFGTDYPIPADKVFTMEVTLQGIGTTNATFAASHTNGTYTQITTNEAGKFTVTLAHDDHLEVFGLPAGTTVTVVEQNPPTGFTASYWDNGVVGDGKVVVLKNNTVSVIVQNAYVAAEVFPVNVHVGGEKVVRDADGNIVSVANWQDFYSFEIVLERFDATNGWVEIGRKTVDNSSNTFSFNDIMAAQKYTAPGAYAYRMYEVVPDTQVDGMVYDRTLHTFSVYVTDTDMNGQLEIARVHSEHANKDFEQVEGVFNVSVTFENTQTVTVPASAAIQIQKLLVNAAGSPAVSLAGYSFGLYTDAACTVSAMAGNGIHAIVLNPTDAVGEGRIDLLFDQSGTYTFYVKEVSGNVRNMTYSEEVVKVEITVTVSGTNANALVASVAYFRPDGSEYVLGADGEVEFTNVYAPTITELEVDFVTKQLSGRPLAEGEFTFEVHQVDPETMQTVKVLEGRNTANGRVVFQQALTYDQVGSYYYWIMETSTDGRGVVTDKTTYRMMVTVTDDNGALKATYSIVNVAGNTITFQNTYTSASVNHTIEGNKTLNGRVLLNDEFRFVLTEVSVDGVAVGSPRNWEVSNFAGDGHNIRFPAITYTRPGTYVYTVRELVSENAANFGISYDGRIYTVTIVVKDDGKGALYIASETVAVGTDVVEEIAFVNNYKANPTYAQVSGEKQLTGKVNNALLGGEYQFELYVSNVNWERKELKETVSNGAGGIFSFTKIDFDSEEDQYFLVAEKNGGETVDGVTYDDTVYRVWVEITDDLKGQLHATLHIYDGAGIPQDKIVFVNVYEIVGNASVELSGEKFLNGRPFQSSDRFAFELYEADEHYNIGQTPAAVVDMDEVTHRYAFTLNYTAADVGKTFYYVVKEQDSGKTIHGVTYSTATYQIKVVVEDNGIGGIRTTVTVENATTSTLHFVNAYAVADEASVSFEGTKELLGKDLGEQKFNFYLFASDANWAKGDIVQSKQNVGAAIAFDTIRYTAAGDYYYLIQEELAGQTVSGITYDGAIYRIHVKVTDNLDGTLSTVVNMEKVEGETVQTAQAIAFTNVYSITGSASVELSGNKTLSGRDWTANDLFHFELLESDAAFETLGNVAATGTANPQTGKFGISLTYGVQDVGKTFYYVLQEQNAGQTANGITYSATRYAITVTVSDGGDGTVKAVAQVVGGTVDTLDFTNSYVATPTSTKFGGTKILSLISGNRELRSGDFTFDLYKANESFEILGAAIESVTNLADGTFAFGDVALSAAGSYYFVVKENSLNPLGGVVYDNSRYNITVTVTDNGMGQLVVFDTSIVKVQEEASEAAEAIVFVNSYSVSVTHATFGGNKVLTGRDLVEGEFRFVLVQTDEAYQIAEGATTFTAVNGADGSFSFDAVSFREAGSYYFVIYEDSTVAAERVTFDTAVYYVRVDVTDNGNGELVASEPVIVKQGGTEAEQAVVFTNVYTPKPADITVDIEVNKTVVNKGTESIGPEGFRFLLQELVEGAEGTLVTSDAEGKGKYTLTFTEEDIGKTFQYTLYEVNDGLENVTYSDALYTITIAVTLRQDTNELVATVSVNEEVVEQAVAVFENIYDYTPVIPDNPKTGDEANLMLWTAMTILSGGAVITLFVAGRRKEEPEYL